MEEIYPKDWKEYKFGDVFDLGGSLSISRANLSDEGICYLHYGDIHKSSDSFIDVNKSYKEIPKYNIALEEVDSKYLLKDGDIVFADASEDYEGIAKSLTVVNKDNKPFISGLHTIVARDKGDLIDNTYKRYFLKDWEIRKQLMTLATGTSVLGISQPNLKKIKVFLPPKEEQNEIGLILSKWDKVIELKEKLIEQKKEQKKGLMQKLLTGDLRLSGFNNPWENRKLSDLCSKIMDGTHSTPKYTQEGVPFYSVENVTSRDFRNHKYISEKEHALISARCKVEKGDILMTRIGSIGDAVIVDWDYESSIYVSLALLKTNDLILSKYLVQYMATNKFKKEILSKSLLNAIPQKINLVDLNKLNIYYPQDLNEQNAIVSILENADREISLLAKELKEIKLQKQALMQQLLTGKIRVKI